MVKKVIGRQIAKFDKSISKYIQPRILTCTDFYALGKYWEIKDITSKVIYKICIDKKFIRPYAEKFWEKECSVLLNTTEWSHIYKCIYEIKYKKFAEFKFKILHNILPCRKKVCKWQNDISPNCEYCNETEDIAHMLFRCSRVYNIWKHLGESLQLNVKLKHVIFGLNCNIMPESNRHLCIVIVSFIIYAMWCKCSVEKINYALVNLKTDIRQQLLFYLSVFESILTDRRRRHFSNTMKCMIEKLY